jgi:hypothetical protein
MFLNLNFILVIQLYPEASTSSDTLEYETSLQQTLASSSSTKYNSSELRQNTLNSVINPTRKSTYASVAKTFKEKGLKSSNTSSTKNYKLVSYSNPLTTSYHVFTYQTGSCYVEANVFYDSIDPNDVLLEYFAKTKEQCCFDCNKLSNCLSWSFDSLNKSCILKKLFRSNPVLRANFFSGFKPTGIFSIAITRGLEFKNINNPIYSILNKPYYGLNATEQYLYDFLILDLENQVFYFYKIFYFKSSFYIN